MRCCHQEGRERVQAVLPTAVVAVMAALRVIPGVAARVKPSCKANAAKLTKISFAATNIQVLHSWIFEWFVLKYIEVWNADEQSMTCVAKAHVRHATETSCTSVVR